MDASILLRDYMLYVTFLYVDTKPGAIPTFSNEMIFYRVLLTKNKKLIWAQSPICAIFFVAVIIFRMGAAQVTVASRPIADEASDQTLSVPKVVKS